MLSTLHSLYSWIAPRVLNRIVPRHYCSDGGRIFDISIWALLLIPYTHFSTFPYFQPIIGN